MERSTEELLRPAGHACGDVTALAEGSERHGGGESMAPDYKDIRGFNLQRPWNATP